MRLPLAWTVVVLLLSTSPAAAHMALDGVGSLLNGLLHPFLVPAQVMLIAGLALMAGRHGYGAIRPALGSFIPGLLIGLVLSATPGGAQVSDSRGLEALILLAGLGSGLMLALGLHPPLAKITGAAAAAGFLIGLDSRVDGVAGWSAAQLYAGMLASGSITTLHLVAVSAEIHTSRPEWMQIALRVVGSWLAAIAVLILSLSVLAPR